jgi:hypothetical protein
MMITDTTSNGIEFTFKPGGPWETESVAILYLKPAHTPTDIEDAAHEIGKHVDVYAFEVIKPSGEAETVGKPCACPRCN